MAATDQKPALSMARTLSSAPADEAELPTERLADRFEIRRYIGSGAHGAVYEVFDHDRRRTVALKSLLHTDPVDLYRFKQEFRALSDFSHPNLVTLHELFVDGDAAFFTMQLVPGKDFLEYVRPGDALDLGRLRSGIEQLAQGLMALHGYGKIHRDLKPSNVLVDRGGRAMLADFGLTREFGAEDSEGLVGTPAYMSPEQAADLELSAASDWYSVGVILYEALTGRFPFEGREGLALLMAKQSEDVPPIELANDDPSAELATLCMDLLARPAGARPTGVDVLRRLGSARQPQTWSSRAGETVPMVGRRAELEFLHEALERTGADPGGAVVTFVHGRSGFGKTTLLSQFLGAAQRYHEAIVLSARCHERESVPYKGLDGVVDALRDRLLREPVQLPAVTGAGALVRLFPVLRAVPGLGDVPAPPAEDPLELRRQAANALRRLLDSLSGDQPVVVQIDDLQWCDEDSVDLLLAVLRPASRPPILLLGSYRAEDADTRPPLVRLRSGVAQLADEVPILELEVGALAETAAAELAASLLRDPVVGVPESIARESEGNPLFVAELARHVQQGGADDGTRESLDLETVVRERAAALPDEAARLLEYLAISAQPITQAVLLEAAEATDDGMELVAVLRTRAFVRTHGPRETDTIEVFHDRIAHALAERIPAPRAQELHDRLAVVHADHRSDPETLAFHLEHAGRPHEAVAYLAQAAETASDALAFRRAAELLTKALAFAPQSDQRRRLQVALADTLAADGRGAAAATAYLDAAASTKEHDDSLELRRRAGEQLLRSGRVAEGMQTLRAVFADLGMRAPRTLAQGIVGLGWQRLRIVTRGTEFAERHEEDVDPAVLLRIDACWAAATGLLQIDVILGQYFQARQLLLALDAGEPHRVARALGMETLYSATSGTPGTLATDTLLEQVRGLSRRLDDPRALGIAGLADGVADLYRGRFVQALPKLVAAEETLRLRCTNVAWELAYVRTFLVICHYYLGDFVAMIDLVERSLKDAEARDDLHGALLLRVTYEPLGLLMRDEVAQARECLRHCREHWPTQLATATYRYATTLMAGRIERYAGEAEASWKVFEGSWKKIVRSQMLSKQPLRVFMLHERGISALAAARCRRGRHRKRLLAVARSCARTLLSERGRFPKAMARPLRASLAAATGDVGQALEESTLGARAFEEAGMTVYLAAMRRRHAELLGEPGRDRVQRSDGLLSAQAADPIRLTAMLMPPVVGWG